MVGDGFRVVDADFDPTCSRDPFQLASLNEEIDYPIRVHK
jgi:hypothetical protein